jgi:hypothetical protein
MVDEFFDWVTALHDSDVRAQFKKLSGDACRNVDTHNKQLGNTAFQIFWDREKSPDVCTVARMSGGSVAFSLNDDSITVRRLTRNEIEAEMTLEAELDEQGQCVLVRRDDGRQILRWHLLREMLGPLFGFEPWKRP